MLDVDPKTPSEVLAKELRAERAKTELLEKEKAFLEGKLLKTDKEEGR